MHKKEIKYVVNLTNKIIALDGRHVDKFGILYLGKKEIKQWNNIYNPLLRRGKIKLAKTHTEAIAILKENLNKSLISPALKRNATVVIDNEERKYNHNDLVKNFITEDNNLEEGATDEKPMEQDEIYESVEEMSETGIPVETEEENAITTSINDGSDEIDGSDEVAEPENSEETVETIEEIVGEETQSADPIEETDKTANDIEETETIDYSKLKVSDLKYFAKERKIKDYAKLKKDELIEALNGE